MVPLLCLLNAIVAAEPAPAPAHADAGPTVAVLYLDYAGEDEELAALRKGLAQMLISDLSASAKLRLVERLQLESVLAELELGSSRSIDSKTAAKVGKLLGAHYLVMGGYFALAGSLRVDARVVHVETGRLVKGVGVTGKGEDFLTLEKELAAGLEAILVGVGPPSPDKPAPPREPAVKQRPQSPGRLRTRTAARYGKALDLIDRGDKSGARAALQEVVAEEPSFGLAVHDLQRLAQ